MTNDAFPDGNRLPPYGKSLDTAVTTLLSACCDSVLVDMMDTVNSVLAILGPYRECRTLLDHRLFSFLRTVCENFNQICAALLNFSTDAIRIGAAIVARLLAECASIAGFRRSVVSFSSGTNKGLTHLAFILDALCRLDLHSVLPPLEAFNLDGYGHLLKHQGWRGNLCLLLQLVTVCRSPFSPPTKLLAAIRDILDLKIYGKKSEALEFPSLQPVVHLVRSAFLSRPDVSDVVRSQIVADCHSDTEAAYKAIKRLPIEEQRPLLVGIPIPELPTRHSVKLLALCAANSINFARSLSGIAAAARSDRSTIRFAAAKALASICVDERVFRWVSGGIRQAGSDSFLTELFLAERSPWPDAGRPWFETETLLLALALYIYGLPSKSRGEALRPFGEQIINGTESACRIKYRVNDDPPRWLSRPTVQESALLLLWVVIRFVPVSEIAQKMRTDVMRVALPLCFSAFNISVRRAACAVVIEAVGRWPTVDNAAEFLSTTLNSQRVLIRAEALAVVAPQLLTNEFREVAVVSRAIWIAVVTIDITDGLEAAALAATESVGALVSRELVTDALFLNLRLLEKRLDRSERPRPRDVDATSARTLVARTLTIAGCLRILGNSIIAAGDQQRLRRIMTGLGSATTSFNVRAAQLLYTAVLADQHIELWPWTEGTLRVSLSMLFRKYGRQQPYNASLMLVSLLRSGRLEFSMFRSALLHMDISDLSGARCYLHFVLGALRFCPNKTRIAFAVDDVIHPRWPSASLAGPLRVLKLLILTELGRGDDSSAVQLLKSLASDFTIENHSGDVGSFSRLDAVRLIEGKLTSGYCICAGTSDASDAEKTVLLSLCLDGSGYVSSRARRLWHSRGSRPNSDTRSLVSCLVNDMEDVCGAMNSGKEDETTGLSVETTCAGRRCNSRSSWETTLFHFGHPAAQAFSTQRSQRTVPTGDEAELDVDIVVRAIQSDASAVIANCDRGELLGQLIERVILQQNLFKEERKKIIENAAGWIMKIATGLRKGCLSAQIYPRLLYGSLWLFSRLEVETMLIYCNEDHLEFVIQHLLGPEFSENSSPEASGRLRGAPRNLRPAFVIAGKLRER